MIVFQFSAKADRVFVGGESSVMEGATNGIAILDRPLSQPTAPPQGLLKADNQIVYVLDRSHSCPA